MCMQRSTIWCCFIWCLVATAAYVQAENQIHLSGSGSAELGSYLIVLVKDQQAWIVTIKDGGGTVIKANELVMVGSPPGPPGPNPPPNPPPPSPLSLKQVAARWRELVPDYAQRDQHAQALSAAYASLATVIESGLIQDMETLVTVRSRAVAIVLGRDLEKWKSWGEVLGARMDELARSEGWSGPLDLVKPFRDISEGLWPGSLNNKSEAVVEAVREVFSKKD